MKLQELISSVVEGVTRGVVHEIMAGYEQDTHAAKSGEDDGDDDSIVDDNDDE